MLSQLLTFEKSAYVSNDQPRAQIMTPRMSAAVPNCGCEDLTTDGELRMVTGRETTQTYHRVWSVRVSN
jgi:hypothetical protein